LNHPNHNILAADKQKLLQLLNERKNRVTVAMTKQTAQFNREEARKTVVERFEDQVRGYGKHLAVKTETEEFTYTALNQMANSIAWRIIENYHAPEGDTVVLLFEHGAAMIAAVLGALKAGKTYVPLDSGYPRTRLAYILNHCAARVILADAANIALAEALARESGKRIQVVNNTAVSRKEGLDNPAVKINRQRSAYIIYTSGSTGAPKGVVQNHRNIMHFIRAYSNELSINATDRIALLTSYSHTVAVIDIFSALLNGAALYPYNLKTPGDPGRLSGWLREMGITVYHTVPTVYRHLIAGLGDAEVLKAIRLVILGGEAVTKSDVASYKRHFGNHCLFVNLFGSSELMVATSYIVDKQTEITGNSVPIGYPVAGVTAHVLNEQHEAAPVFVPGELVYLSEYLALGYLNQPEKTGEVFGADSKLGGRVYRSGDLGRQLPDGRLEYLGRKDFQIKVRGLRIEPGEIETVLDGIAGIKKSVAAYRQDDQGEGYLLAFYETMGGIQLEEEEIKALLKENLPEYMIPRHLIFLKQIPLTPNGKIDRQALPDPDQLAGGADYETPATEAECRLLPIWRETLGVKRIGRNDNFFKLGGHSLKATRLITGIHKEFQIEVSLKEVFNHPTIKKLAAQIAGLAERGYTAIPLAAPQEYYPLSAAQMRMYVLNVLEQGGTSYNTPGAVMITGALERDKLERVFQVLVDRHEALRTSFTMVGAEPVQKIHPWVNFRINYREAVDMEEVNSLTAGFVKPFDLSVAPLFRVELVKIAAGKYLLLFDLHHIISDGTSVSLLMREFLKVYNGRELPELRIQYKDFAVWQNKLFQNAKLKKQEEYWLNLFRGAIPTLNLPTDYPRPPVMDYAGDSYQFALDRSVTAALRRLTLRQDVTVFGFVLAVYNVFLSKLTGQEDLVVGTPVAGRNHADLQNVFGMFLNTLALRNHPAQQLSFSSFLQQVRENLLQAFENQDYQFEMLLEQLSLKRDPGRNPLFDTVLNSQKMFEAPPVSRMAGLEFAPWEWDAGRTSTFDIILYLFESTEQIKFKCDFRTSLFAKSTIVYLMNELVSLFAEVIQNPDRLLHEYQVFSRKRRLAAVNPVKPALMNHKFSKAALSQSLVGRFETQAERNCRQIAVKTEQIAITYQKLNWDANTVAAAILAKDREQFGAAVALLFEHGAAMITGIMGVLKAGKIFVPLDPGYPYQRLEYMLTDAGAKLIVTNDRNLQIAEALGNKTRATILNLDQLELGICRLNPGMMIAPDQAAYIMYTSGSTGRPKGVVQSHRNIMNFIRIYTQNLRINAGDQIGLFTSYSHTVAMIDIFSALLTGAAICPYDLKATDGLVKLPGWLNTVGITIFHATPTVYRYGLACLQAQEVLSRIRLVVLGGEAVLQGDHELFKRHFTADCLLVNLFGASEVLIATMYIINRQTALAGLTVPIGYGVEDVTIHLLDEANEEVTVYQVGELVYESDYLALEYWKLPEATAKVFRNVPEVASQGRLYWSGDLGRQLPDGRLEYLGRKDFQVKIRGYRIELSEIEAVLANVVEINRSAVQTFQRPNGENYLVAYYTTKDGVELPPETLEAICTQQLPDYMRPAFFLHLEELPLTPNGKLDRQVLPEPEVNAGAGREDTVPRDETEAKLVAIWGELLGLDRIGIDDNFFQLGGHSLKAMILAVQISQQFEVELSIRELFVNQTIRKIAELIRKSSAEKAIIAGILKEMEAMELN
jgi:amino acid adenylation domain-containing protein